MSSNGIPSGRPVMYAGLAGDEFGSPGATASLVLLHGLTFDRKMWGPAITALHAVDPDRHVLALDLPGHGGSEPMKSYALADVATALDQAVRDARLELPVVVGHSIAAVICSIYAARHPTSGVVNVDQPLQIGPFASFLRSMGDQLRSPAFQSIWKNFLVHMQIELSPPDAQAMLLAASARTPQAVVLGYWHDILNVPPDELDASVNETLAGLRDRAVPYMVVAGAAPDVEYTKWLAQEIPQATVDVLPASGHFPHLVYPDQFARCLARTRSWSTDS